MEVSHCYYSYLSLWLKTPLHPVVAIRSFLDQQLHAGGRVLVQHPNAKDSGIGYVVEQIDWFAGVIPDGITPVNHDAEVAQFALLQPLELKSQMESNVFTLDASLILSRALSHH